MSSGESSPVVSEPAGGMCLPPPQDMIPESSSGEVLIRHQSPSDPDLEVVYKVEYENTSENNVLSPIREELTCLREEVEELRRKEQARQRCTILDHGEGDSSRFTGYRHEQNSSSCENVNSNFQNNLRQPSKEVRGVVSRQRTEDEANIPVVHYHRGRQPAIYDGTSSWRDYHVHFEMISQLNWWDDKSKALELAVSLRGNAQSVLSDLSHKQRRNYHDLVSALASRFEPDNQSELYRLEMKHRQRKRGESLNELAQEVKRLTNKAYPAAPVGVREQLARDCFLDALNDPEMEWAVHQVKPKSMDDAAHLALEFESFRSGRKVKLGVRPHTIMMQDTEPGGTSFDTNSGPRVGEASEVGKLMKDISGRLNALEKTGARASINRVITKTITTHVD
ncbi:hypothetical protein ACJMK2_019831 [Sinanodonta woodiana]|uniref:Retrotransposon gag domain-containing protein n=1 Tax=Sinanodonta woodiana TaxID=1069815 RepID=A0ABD3TY71_SINWO